MLARIFEKLEEFDREDTHFDAIYSLLEKSILSGNGKIIAKSCKLLENMTDMISNKISEEASSFVLLFRILNKNGMLIFKK